MTHWCVRLKSTGHHSKLVSSWKLVQFQWLAIIYSRLIYHGVRGGAGNWTWRNFGKTAQENIFCTILGMYNVHLCMLYAITYNTSNWGLYTKKITIVDFVWQFELKESKRIIQNHKAVKVLLFSSAIAIYKVCVFHNFNDAVEWLAWFCPRSIKKREKSLIANRLNGNFTNSAEAKLNM